MSTVNVHGLPEQDRRAVTPWSAWLFGRPGPASLKFWLTGIAFLALYLAFHKLAESHELDGLGITLWSPDNGFSLGETLTSYLKLYLRGDLTQGLTHRPELLTTCNSPTRSQEAMRRGFWVTHDLTGNLPSLPAVSPIQWPPLSARRGTASAS